MVSTVTELPGACESGCATSDMFGIVYGAVEWQRAGFREQWDDMAIVREAQNGDALERQEGGKSASIEEVEEGEERHERGHPAASAGAEEGIYGQPNAARFAGYATGTDAFAYQQQQHSHQQQTSSDVYQAAYAQAYAQLQAQFQAAYPAAAAQQPYGHGTQMPAFPAQSSHYPPPRPFHPCRRRSLVYLVLQLHSQERYPVQQGQTTALRTCSWHGISQDTTPAASKPCKR
ncbi:hypothetical protein GQ600_1514 [Phytophthora cactorum]|nr:hypothetical protein GQ600_1514 [Phytophthora cactorum]